MRAVVVTRTAGPSALELLELPEPVRGPREVLVDVHAAGVAFPDLLYTSGQYQHQPELPFVLGQEGAGVVRQAPADSRLAPGDRVAVFSPGLGAFAETVSVPADGVVPLPDAVSFQQGACLPVNYLTAHFALKTRGALRAGYTVLVHGAAGGVGSAAVQIARAEGARVIAVTSDQSKAEVARRLGAHDAVLADGFLQAVQALAPGGVDLVVDPVGGDRFPDSMRALGRYGKLLVIGFTGGGIPTVKVNKLLFTNTDIVGVGWGGVAAEPGFIAEQWQDLLPHLQSGACLPLVGDLLPLAQASQALALLEDRRAVGKVVLAVRPS